MNAITTSDHEEAVAWAVRTSDPLFTDWEAFASWLDGDAGRNAVYNRAMAVAGDSALTLSRQSSPAPLPPVPRRRRTGLPVRRRVAILAGAGASIAAGVAGVLFVARPDVPRPFVVEAPLGAPRTITLADGSRIDMAAGARLVLDRADARRARLDRGRAMFIVRHDASAPFRVLVAGYEIVDAGTAFEVAEQGTDASVAVAEGRVIVDPARRALTLDPGDSVALHAGTARIARVAPASVGQWRRSRMTYRDAPLALVATDLSAALGRPVTVDAALAGRRFTGTLMPATLRDRPDDLAALLDVGVHDDAAHWELRAR